MLKLIARYKSYIIFFAFQLIISNAVYSQLTGPVCNVPIGQEVTYKYEYPTGSPDYYSFDWSITAGSAQITYNDNNGTVKVKWATATGQILVNITAWEFDGYDEYGYPINVIVGQTSDAITTSVTPTTVTNSIRATTPNVYLDEVPGPVLGAAITSSDCLPDVTYQWYMSTSASGPFNPIPGGEDLSFSTTLPSQTYFFQRKVTMVATGTVSFSNIVQFTVGPYTRPDPDCIDFLGKPITYTIGDVNAGGDQLDINWTIPTGAGHIISDNYRGTVIVKWWVLPAVLKCHVTITHNEGLDEYGYPINTITEQDYSFTANANSTTLPNNIKSSTGNTSFSYTQIPDPIIETVSSSGQPTCSAVKYQWWSSSTAGGPFSVINGAEAAQLNFSTPLQQTTYFKRVIIASDGATSYSNTIKLDVVSANWENLNYVREHTVLVPGITDWKAVDQLPIGQKLQTTTYIDNLGRPVEKVDREMATPAAGNNLWGDVVQLTDYDPYGRRPKQYLPYTTTTQSGKFKSDPHTGQSQYYAATYNDTWSYNSISYESSPLNRIINVKSPGASWANAAGSSSAYDLNDASDNVQMFNIGYATGATPNHIGTYPDNTLLKIISVDENGKRNIQYTDKNGLVILKKVQLNDNPSAAHDGWICTYNIYDDFGHLRYELQPEAVKWLDGHGWSFSQPDGPVILNEYCFRYEYDERGRTIVKKAPGAKELDMLYDRRNRVVFMQDGNQRAKATAEWGVTFYDELDRVVETALYSTAKTSTDLQADANNSVNITSVTVPASGLAVNDLVVNTRDVNVSRYAAGNSIEFDPGFTSPDNDNFVAEIDPSMLVGTTTITAVFNSPVSAADMNDPSKFTALRYNYYDNYGYTGVKAFDNNFNNSVAYSSDPTIDPIAKTGRTTGMLTGTKVRVIGTTTFLLSSLYYDEKGRAIQKLEENIKSGTDIITSQYHFSGRLLSSEIRHSASNTVYTNYSILTKYLFDKIGRVTSIQKKYGTNGFKTVASYDMDDLGRLKTKHLDPGYTGSGKNELESLTYSYNIHGDITGINKDYALKTPGQYDKWGNFFGMYLGYDNADGVFADRKLDGHVTGALWSTQGDDAQRKYDYTYDNAGRLINALYNEKKKTGDAWSHSTMDFSVTGSNGKIEYDLNGNLLSMQQNGVLPGNSTPLAVDDLHYAYDLNNKSNRLTKVIDNSPLQAMGANGKLGDFTDGTNGSNDDYVYDDNGNLITDLNKAITGLNGASGIRYNYLDKPEEILISGKGTVKIVYDADGHRLQKIYTPTGSSTGTVTSYINGFVYQGDDLQYIDFEEGRIRVMPVNPGNGHDYYISNGYDYIQLDGNIDLPGTKRGAYDYFIRDYQGNVRMTLTEESHVGSNSCTLEMARAANEEPVFGQVDAAGTPTAQNEVKARFLVSNIPGQNVGAGWQNSAIQSYVSRIGNLAGKKMGPNTLLKVMAGDDISATAIYYYQNPVDNSKGSVSIVQDVLLSMAQAISGSPVTSALEKTAATSITSPFGTSVPFSSLVDPDANNTTGSNPKAYLAVLYFDERFNLISEASLTQRVSQSGNGAPALNIPHLKAPKNGYAYVYLSNESDEMVYFDNFQVTHTRGRIIEENHYYAYGLKISAISSRKLADPGEGHIDNKNLFNGKELMDEGDLDWYDYGLRSYDAQVGRFTQLDPLTFEYPFYTPYQYAGCEPVGNIDRDGAEGEKVTNVAEKLANTGGISNINMAFSRGFWSLSWNAGGMAHAIHFTTSELALQTFATPGMWNLIFRKQMRPNGGSNNPNLAFIGGGYSFKGAPNPFAEPATETAVETVTETAVETTVETSVGTGTLSAGALAFFLAPFVIEYYAPKDIAPQPAPAPDITNVGVQPGAIYNLPQKGPTHKVYEIGGHDLSKPGQPWVTLKYGVADMKYDTYSGEGNRRPDGQLGGLEGELLRAKYPNLMIRQKTLAYFDNKPAAHVFENNMVYDYRDKNIRPDPTNPDFGLPPPEQGLPYGFELR